MVLSEEKKDKLLAETRLSASRSNGPGGQNVNKVSTKIELRFPIETSKVLTEFEKHTLLIKLQNRINSAGELIVVSAVERSQWKNRQKAETKFLELIEKALTKQKKRKKTQPTTASKIKRIEHKKQQSIKKSYRKPPEI